MMRSSVKSNPVLFWLWYHLYRKHRGVRVNWFKKESSFYFDGFPRSGNTFGIFLIRSIWPQLHVVHHLHAVAPIKIALKRKLPVFILFRDPLNAISSYYLKHFALRGRAPADDALDQTLLQMLISDYIQYYQYVNDNRNRVNLFTFGMITKSPAEVMKNINSKLPERAMLNDATIEAKVNELKDKPFGAKDKLGASFPTVEKEIKKKKVIVFLQNHPDFQKCQSLYQNLA
ncbi:MAG: hypothetical protein WD077_08490 [Bacteroidia bacterium]